MAPPLVLRRILKVFESRVPLSGFKEKGNL